MLKSKVVFWGWCLTALYSESRANADSFAYQVRSKGRSKGTPWQYYTCWAQIPKAASSTEPQQGQAASATPPLQPSAGSRNRESFDTTRDKIAWKETLLQGEDNSKKKKEKVMGRDGNKTTQDLKK